MKGLPTPKQPNGNNRILNMHIQTQSSPGGGRFKQTAPGAF